MDSSQSHRSESSERSEREENAWPRSGAAERVSPGRRLLIVTAIITLALASVGSSLAWRDQRSETDRIRDDTATYAEARATNVDRYLTDRLDLLSTIAVAPVFRTRDNAAIRDFLLEIDPDGLGFTGGMVWIDLQNQIQIATDRDQSELPIPVNGTAFSSAVLSADAPYISAAYQTATSNTWVVALAVPTHDAAGAITGALGGRIGLDLLNQIAQQSPFESGSLTLIVDRAGQLIVAPEVAGAEPEVRDVSSSPLVARFLDGSLQNGGSRTGISGARGNEDRLVGYAQVPVGNWLVMIDRSAEEAFRPVRTVLLVEILALAAISILGLGGAMVVGRRLDRLALAEQATLRALIGSERRFRELVEGLPDAVVVAGDDGRILEANPAAIALLGSSRDELLTLRIDDLRGDGAPAPPFPVPTADGGDAPEWRGETSVRRRDGVEIPVEIWSRRISLPSGAATISAIRDITDRKAQETFEQNFLADVAHDLKTPLTVTKAQVQLLQRRLRQGRLEEADLSESLAVFKGNADRMSGRLDVLSDLARLRSGRQLDLSLQSVDLLALVEESIASYRRSTDRHTISLADELTMTQGVWDPDRLRRVVDNLLANAIKYSPDGGEIEVSLTNETRDGRSWAIIAVRDQGQGILADELPLVFERYRRGSNVAPTIGGTGIGLSGARQIVEQHGGTIEVQSTEGQGSVFTIALPLEPEPAPVAARV